MVKPSTSPPTSKQATTLAPNPLSRTPVSSLVHSSKVNRDEATGALTTTVQTSKGLVQAKVLMPVGGEGDMAVSFLPRPFQKRNSGVKWTADEVSGFKLSLLLFLFCFGAG